MKIELHANLANDNRSDNDTVSETKPKDQELFRFLWLARMLINVESNYKKGK